MAVLAWIIHRLRRGYFLNGITVYEIIFSYENWSHLLQLCSEKLFIWIKKSTFKNILNLKYYRIWFKWLNLKVSLVFPEAFLFQAAM